MNHVVNSRLLELIEFPLTFLFYRPIINRRIFISLCYIKINIVINFSKPNILHNVKTIN